MISKFSLLASFLLLAFSGLQAEPLAPPEVKALLERIRAKRAGAPQVQADFREEKTVRLMNKPIRSTGNVWFQEPAKFRREVEGNSPSITVSNGRELWIYYPKFKSAEHYSLGKRSPLDAGLAALTAALNLQNVESNYHLQASREGNGYELQLAPRNPSLKRLLESFTIQMNADLQVQRTVMVQPKGDRVVMEYSNESRAPIEPSKFEFTPPAGTDVTTPLGR
ncbi:MAG: outer membrane lipoprotein carrier protein LolA [Chthoniobacterales bacterium]|nr:outer membrane lipoprotein carrier protein LolA [Chthoniobacterales bacterium]